jgi:hypothetical protein
MEEETNYLVTKGYSWSDIRGMESWRRKKYCTINNEIDEAVARASNPGSNSIGSFLR